MISRRAVPGSAGAAAMSPFAQQPARVPRIGYISIRSNPGLPLFRALMQGSHDFGYIEGTCPANTLVEQINELKLDVVLKTPGALGIKIPQSIRVRADRIVP